MIQKRLAIFTPKASKALAIPQAKKNLSKPKQKLMKEKEFVAISFAVIVILFLVAAWLEGHEAMFY